MSTRNEPVASETAESPIIDPRMPRKLSQDCPLNIHISGHDGGGEGSCYFPWDFRMNRVGETTVTYVNDAERFILDSAISDDEVDNEDVIHSAKRLEPDYVIAADVWLDPVATTDRVIEFIDMLDDAGIDADPIIPLQPTGPDRADHADHYHDVEHLGDYFAVGGVKDSPQKVKRDAVENVRAVAGEDVELHGLGFGTGYFADPRVLSDLRLDSIDTNGPIQNARKGQYWTFENGRLEKKEVPRPQGEMALGQISLLSGLTLFSVARLVLTGANNPEELREDGQNGVSDYL